jgi:hypothetical protein
VGSARGEGESPTAELVGLGGEKGQESIGCSGCLTIPGMERLLNRSKALESGSMPVRVNFAGPKPSLLKPAWASCVDASGLGSASRHWACWFAGKFRD